MHLLLLGIHTMGSIVCWQKRHKIQTICRVRLFSSIQMASQTPPTPTPTYTCQYPLPPPCALQPFVVVARCQHAPLNVSYELYMFFIRICRRVSHSAKVNIYGLPYIREMPKITGISGSDLIVKCPVAGYPIDKIHWERGKQQQRHL